jgi:hypothetical protein
VLIATGAKQDRYDKTKWHTARGAISITGSKFMNWNMSFGGGGAIDLAMHLKNLSFKETVQWLWNHFPCAGSVPDHPLQPYSKLVLPAKNRGMLQRVKNYLLLQRRLSPPVIQSLIQSGTLYADKRGNAVFILLGKRNTPVGAELQGTGQRRWKGMAPGSRKDLGYFSVSPPTPEKIILCESAIDAISCFSLQNNCMCVSTAGARSNPRWLAGLISAGYEISCGFDADTTGDDRACSMMAQYPTIKRLRPSLHDWNDMLKADTTWKRG